MDYNQITVDDLNKSIELFLKERVQKTEDNIRRVKENNFSIYPHPQLLTIKIP